MDDPRVAEIARLICCTPHNDFCRDVGGDLGCKCGRGTMPSPEGCAADEGQLELSGIAGLARQILAALTTPSETALQARLRTEFLPAILHGDEQHRAWLAAAVDAFIAGEPIPAPTGSGNKEARIAVLEGVLKKAAIWFDEYARGHYAKGTADGNDKGERNQDRANQLRQALNKGTTDGK